MLFPIKISPLIIFILLLFILVIIVFIKQYSNVFEGFIDFDSNGSQLTQIIIPPYNTISNLYKLYDNIFFDNTNGNIIVIGGSRTGTPDKDGSTINIFEVFQRDGTSELFFNYDISNNILLPLENNMYNNNTTNIIPSLVSFYFNTSTYTVFYIPWGSDTYIHIIDGSIPKHVNTFYFNNSSNVYMYPSTGNFSSSIPIAKHLYSSGSNKDYANNTIVVDNYYDTSRKLYQLSNKVKYDISNGSVIVDISGGVTYYDRAGDPSVSNLAVNSLNGKITNNSISSVPFNTEVIVDDIGLNMVLLIPNGLNTIVTVATCYQQGNAVIPYQYSLTNVARFNLTTLINYLPQTGGNNSGNTMPGKSDGNYNGHHWGGNYDGNAWTGNNGNAWSGNNSVSDYYNNFFNLTGMDARTMPNFNDYILKTSVVPPVCPSCPFCPSNLPGSVCTSCGGNGGAGLAINDNGNTNLGTKIKNTVSTVGNQLQSTAQNVGTDINSVANSIGNKTQNVLSTAGSDVQSIGNYIGSGAQNVASTIGGDLKSVADTVGSSISNVGNYIGGGISGQNNGQINVNGSSYGYNSTPQTNNGSSYYQNLNNVKPDIYNQYGALTSQKSNFMPVTASFSAFGK